MPHSTSQFGTLYLVRHGETALTGTYCGSTNPPLSSRGRLQAREAARALSRIPIDACFSSPLLRARQTAAVLRRRQFVPLRMHPALKELHFGAWEGLRFQEIEKKWPGLAGRWAKDPTRVRLPRAETYLSLRKRIRRFLSFVKQKFSNQHVLVVAHGGPLSVIVLELLRLPNKDFSKYIPPPASVRRIQGCTVKWIHRC